MKKIIINAGNKISINTYLLAGVFEMAARELYKAEKLGVKTISFNQDISFKTIMRFLLPPKRRYILDRISMHKNGKEGK